MTLTPEQSLAQVKSMTLTPGQSLEKMWEAADHFYILACATNCHAYIEFTGLLREYCKVCENNLERGIDFRELNGHGSQRMQLRQYEIDYFNEKLNCIFLGLLKVERFDEGVTSDG